MNNDQLIHLWAQNNASNKSAGNLSIKDNILYSYREAIGIPLNNGYRIISCYRFSSTTQRHQSKAINAMPHDRYMTTDRLLNPYTHDGRDETKLCNEIVLEKVNLIDSLITKALRARTNTDYYINNAIYATNDLMRFINFLNLTLPESCQWILNLNSNVPDSPALKDFLESKGIDLKARQAKEKEANRIKKEKAEAVRLEQQNKLLEKLSEWKSGAQIPMYHLDNIYLRFINNVIETSKGAQVPFKDALTLLDDVRMNNNIQGKQYGNFTGREINEHFVVIGCHSIPKIEILRLANQLGL